ncbi:MAG: hypothetical protein ABXS91_08745 [Sulfurimonas sp.]
MNAKMNNEDIYLANKYRLANVIGLDANIAQHNVALTDAMQNIIDMEAFLEYCRSNRESISYATKVEKLDILSTRYKRLQLEADLPNDTAKSFSKTICDLLMTHKTHIKNAIIEGVDRPISSIKGRNSAVVGAIFSDKEIKALSGLRKSPSQIISMLENGDLEEALVKLFLDRYLTKNRAAMLTPGQHRVSAMIGKVWGM